MLSKSALQSAVPLADVLEGSSRCVTARPGTPLAALVGATRLTYSDGSMATSGYMPTVDDIEYLANCKDSSTGLCNHDVVMDEISAAGIKAVQSMIQHARTVVAPAVIDLVNKVETELGNTTKSALKDMEVVSVHYPEILYDNSFKKDVFRFEEMAYDDPILGMKCPTIATSEIRDLMKVGSAGADKSVEEWLAQKGENFLINLWENVFQISQNPLSSTGPSGLRSWLDDRENGLDNALAIYLIARRLSDQGPLDNTDMPGDRFASMIVDFRDQAGLALCREITRLEAAEKAGQLVLRAKDKKVWVDSKVYDKWLSEGGEVEILYGNILLDNQHSTTEALTANAATLKDAWYRHERITKVADDNRRYTRTTTYLRAMFQRAVSEMGEEEKAKVNPVDVMERFQNELSQATDKDLDCLYSLCLRLVCRSRFYYSDAEALLSAADVIMKNNPGCNEREAMALATIQYTARWVALQMQVGAQKVN